MLQITVKTKELQTVRAVKGLTLTELARKADVSQSILSYLEAGKKHPRPTTAKKICDALEVDFGSIFEVK